MQNESADLLETAYTLISLSKVNHRESSFEDRTYENCSNLPTGTQTDRYRYQDDCSIITNINLCCQSIAYKITLKLRKIQRAAPFLSKPCRTILVNSLVMPYFDYCSETWSSASITSLRRLTNLYNKARKMKEMSPKDPTSLDERFKRNTAIMMFKCLNGLAPNYLSDRFRRSAQVHKKNTRSAADNKIYVEHARGKASSSFRARGTKVWNDLSGPKTSKNGILQFKTSLSPF